MYGNDFYLELGKKLRARRKARHLTLSDLANMLDKSVSTVSKYEKGEIAIATNDFLNICIALNIDVASILPSTVAADKGFEKYRTNFPKQLYLYWYNREKNKIGTAVFINDEKSFKSTLYFDVQNPDNIYDCHFVYTGEAILSDASTVFQCVNVDPPFDILMLRLPTFHRANDSCIGLLSTVTSYYQSVSVKIFASQTPITNPSTLLDKLTFSHEEIKELKRTNMFTIL